MKLTAVALMFQVMPLVLKHLVERKGRGEAHDVGNQLLRLMIDAEDMFDHSNATQKRQHVLDKARKAEWREGWDDAEIAELVDYMSKGVGHSLDDEFEFALITCIDVAASAGATLASGVLANNCGVAATAAFQQQKMRQQAELAQGVKGPQLVKP